MTASGEEPPSASSPRATPTSGTSTELGSWRERAVERSLREARARAQDRSSRFLEAAEQLMRETGSIDFTVQQLVERARMSLRSFYQHFGSKDELLLVVFQEGLRAAVDGWRDLSAEIDDPVERMHVVVAALYGTPVTAREGSDLLALRRLARYHLQLVGQRPDDVSALLEPLHELLSGIVQQGVAAGCFRRDLDPDALTVLLLHSLVAVSMLYLLDDHARRSPLTAEQLWAFLGAALQGPVPPATSTAARTAADRVETGLSKG